MDYTQIEEYRIDGSNQELENELMVIWAKFCFKSKPLPIFESEKTVSRIFVTAYRYFEENFVGNTCFFIENEAFVVFGNGQKWLDTPILELNDKNTSVLIMAASLNNNPKSSWQKISCLRECFSRQKNKGVDIIAWNLNRQFKRKPFERMIKIFNAEQIKDCQYVKL